MLVEQLAEARRDRGQPALERQRPAGVEITPPQTALRRCAARLDDAEAGGGGAGVNPEDP